MSRNYGTIAPDSIAQNEVFGKWLPPTTGSRTYVYTGSYIISSDNGVDNFPTNDTIRFPFALTDSLYQNEPGTGIYSTRPGDAAWGASDPHNWKVGQFYYFPKGGNVTATRIRAFVDSASIVGEPLLGSLYEWNDANNDGQVQVGERTQVAAGEAIVPKADPAGMDFILENLQGTGPIKLKDKTAYIAMVEFITTKRNIDMRVYFTEAIANAAMKFATATAGRPRYSNIISYDGTDTRPWLAGTFAGDNIVEKISSVVRMWSWPVKTDTKELLSENNKISLFPNPAQSKLNIAFDLEKREEAVLVRIIDMSGKILRERDYSDVKTETISLDVNELPNGIYNLQIQTLGNYRTMRFVKAE